MTLAHTWTRSAISTATKECIHDVAKSTATKTATESTKAAQQLKALDIHASEHSWIGAPFDAVIDNNGEIGDLYNQIKKLLPSTGMQATR